MVSSGKSTRRRYKEFKANCACFSCGSKDLLQMHHFDPNQKFMAVADMVKMGYDWAEVKDELNKTVPVCDPCHVRIHKANPQLRFGGSYR